MRQGGGGETKAGRAGPEMLQLVEESGRCRGTAAGEGSAGNAAGEGGDAGGVKKGEQG